MTNIINDMPYKSELIKIEWTMLDRRRKLSEEDIETIKSLYPTLTQQQIAIQFNVSRSLIGMYVNPVVAATRAKYIKENWKSYRNTKSDHAKAIAEVRRYKQKLYLEWKIHL